jgi:hypothetical protein
MVTGDFIDDGRECAASAYIEKSPVGDAATALICIEPALPTNETPATNFVLLLPAMADYFEV